MGKNHSHALVLNMGGTGNADHAKTERFVDPADGQPKTNIHPWRDSRGRMPAQIFLEDFHPELAADYMEISDRDSKDITEEQIGEMHRRIDAAYGQGYDLVVVIGGTDKQVDWARTAEERGLQLPLPFVGAMHEATLDYDAARGQFDYAPGKEMRSDLWQRLLNALTRAPSAPGAYIEVDGKFERAHNVEKDFNGLKFKLRESA